MTTASPTSDSYETRLVERMQSGDSKAVEEFYNIYRRRLHYLILERVDRNQTVADDLVQEVFVAALSSLGKFRGDSQLFTWLRSIAFHKLNDLYRRRAREPKVEDSAPDVQALKLEQATDTAQPIHSAMESEETRQEVQQALVDLPQDYKEVLVLKYLKEMPVMEISQVMGRSPKSVEGLLTRARRALRTSLVDHSLSD